MKGPDGELIKLTQYETQLNCITGSSKIIDQDRILENSECCPGTQTAPPAGTRIVRDIGESNNRPDTLPIPGCRWVPKDPTIDGLEILNPIPETVFGAHKDRTIPYVDIGFPDGQTPYLLLPEDDTAAQVVAQNIGEESFRNYLLVKLHFDTGDEKYLTVENMNSYGELTIALTEDDQGDGE